MKIGTVEYIQHKLYARSLENGGFRANKNQGEQVDATAWATLALRLTGGNEKLIFAGCERLAAKQLPNGSTPLITATPDSYWPTSICLLAWDQDISFAKQRRKALHFLLSHGGITLPAGSPYIAHNTTLQGWAWVSGTYSWVEPTSLALWALASQGEIKHQRYLEGVDLLKDRMIPSGGWNYGNIKVFDSSLKPFPDYTGMALFALRNDVSVEQVELSLNYLEEVCLSIKTPFTLSWVLLGLQAFDRTPQDAIDRITKCLSLEEKYGEFDTPLIALLLIALSYLKSGKGG